MKKIVSIIAASLLTVGGASAASAASFEVTPGSPATFAAPAGGTVITFDDPLPAGFVLTGSNAAIVNGSVPGGNAEPAFSDGSNYLSVFAGGIAALGNSSGYQSISLFLGSIDTYNTISLIDTLGNVIASYPGYMFASPASGDQSDSLTNARITFYRSEGDPLLGGVVFQSDFNSAEVDNVVFAVPEPSMWALMITGFGLVGLAMRSRRRRRNVVFA